MELPEQLTINGVVYTRSDIADTSNPECLAQTCTYYTHYLVYYDSAKNGERLEHAPYHTAEERCSEAQRRLTDWLERHMNDDGHTPIPSGLEQQAEFWERRVCA